MEASVIDTRGEEGVFGDDLWRSDDSRGRMRSLTDETNETDGSDFTPAQLEMMKRRISTERTPLPRGVRDVQWQAPSSTGLEHSDPIFETETDTTGRSCMSSKGINKNNCHFRSWQEDNGIAKTFASQSVEKDVDGETRTVLISPGISMRMTGTSVTAMMTSDLRLMVRSSPTNSSAGGSGDEAQNDAEEGEVPGTMSLPADESNTRPSSVSWHPSVDVVSDAAKGGNSAQSNTNDGDLTSEGNVKRSSCSSTTGSNKVISPAPRRPSGSPATASCHRQHPRPGRSLSTKEVVDDANLLALEKKERGEEGARRPSDVSSSTKECDVPPVVEGRSYVGASCLGKVTGAREDAGAPTAETAGAVSGSDVGCEATRVGGGQDDLGGRNIHKQGEGANGGTRGETNLDPCGKGSRKTSKSWWAGLRAPRGPSPDPSQRLPQGQIQRQQQHYQERPEHPTQQGVLPSGPGAAVNSMSPQWRGWLTFRCRRPRNAA